MFFIHMYSGFFIHSFIYNTYKENSNSISKQKHLAVRCSISSNVVKAEPVLCLHGHSLSLVLVSMPRHWRHPPYITSLPSVKCTSLFSVLFLSISTKLVNVTYSYFFKNCSSPDFQITSFLSFIEILFGFSGSSYSLQVFFSLFVCSSK